MSTFNFITSFTETTLDNDECPLNYYTNNLPHHSLIIKKACESWNEMHMEQYYDGILENKVKSAVMSAFRDRTCSKNCSVKIAITLEPGIRMTEKYRKAITEQTSAQLTDGWGEGFFGYINVMSDGKTKFIVE